MTERQSLREMLRRLRMPWEATATDNVGVVCVQFKYNGIIRVVRNGA